jgi:hypothetical protein
MEIPMAVPAFTFIDEAVEKNVVGQLFRDYRVDAFRIKPGTFA